MKNIIILIISIFFSVQVSAQTQEVLPTDETSKTNLAGEYVYADSYFKKSKTVDTPFDRKLVEDFLYGQFKKFIWF